MTTTRLLKLLILYPLFLLLGSCGKYLDIRSKSSLAVPKTLEDCQGLLDDFYRMNASYPADGELSSGDFYLTTDDWLSLTDIKQRERYIWDSESLCALDQWKNAYDAVYNANLVLETLLQMDSQNGSNAQFNAVKGSALFFRAYAFFQVAQLFAPPYRSDGSNDAPAIPLRLSASIDVPSVRATVAETYTQIVADLELATGLLPLHVPIVSRPSKAAGFAMLARVELTMENYRKALEASTNSLNIQHEVLDFNLVDQHTLTPFAPRFNPEVIFHSSCAYSTPLSPYTAKVDSVLIRSYADNDLRKNLFFNANEDGSYAFKGSYDGNYNEVLFTGLTTAEMLLTAAECQVRAGNGQLAIDQLNLLLAYRIKDGLPNPIDPKIDLLKMILAERRKELLFRGLRWTDLRRLNQDPHFAITLSRKINGTSYQLTPGDSRYILLLPQEVIDYSTMSQNKR